MNEIFSYLRGTIAQVGSELKALSILGVKVNHRAYAVDAFATPASIAVARLARAPAAYPTAPSGYPSIAVVDVQL